MCSFTPTLHSSGVNKAEKVLFFHSHYLLPQQRTSDVKYKSRCADNRQEPEIPPCLIGHKFYSQQDTVTNWKNNNWTWTCITFWEQFQVVNAHLQTLQSSDTLCQTSRPLCPVLCPPTEALHRLKVLICPFPLLASWPLSTPNPALKRAYRCFLFQCGFFACLFAHLQHFKTCETQKDFILWNLKSSQNYRMFGLILIWSFLQWDISRSHRLTCHVKRMRAASSLPAPVKVHREPLQPVQVLICGDYLQLLQQPAASDRGLIVTVCMEGGLLLSFCSFLLWLRPPTPYHVMRCLHEAGCGNQSSICCHVRWQGPALCLWPC